MKQGDRPPRSGVRLSQCHPENRRPASHAAPPYITRVADPPNHTARANQLNSQPRGYQKTSETNAVRCELRALRAATKTSSKAG